mmetsp:Transcript_14393/g.54299  ORF Transcript_14393/g.54299 Transcript_14393/m.54299 type:complete len:82 (-) Transcript_14393:71-316(-)
MNGAAFGNKRLKVELKTGRQFPGNWYKIRSFWPDSTDCVVPYVPLASLGIDPDSLVRSGHPKGRRSSGSARRQQQARAHSP